jgi:hypothetical protein
MGDDGRMLKQGLQLGNVSNAQKPGTAAQHLQAAGRRNKDLTVNVGNV